MNYIFFFLISLSIVSGFVNGTTDKVLTALFDGCNLAVKIAFSLIGIMAFWLGIMRITEKSGLIKILSRLIYPLLRPLFKDLDKASPTLGNIAMSLSANALGLTNAATPMSVTLCLNL